MALSHSPQIVTDGLAFYYDMGNPQKSWKGAPTTNVVAASYDVTFESTAEGNTSGFVNQLGTGNFLGVALGRGYNSNKSLRINRGTGGTGRAYRTYGVSLGEFSSVSAWVWSDVPGPFITIEYFGGDYNWGVAQTRNTHSGTGWERLWVRTNSSATSATTGYYFLYPSVQNKDTFWDDIQVEKQPFATPFVAGTRSNTQAISDLTNSNTVTANSLTYAADGTFSFNGTTDYTTLSPNIFNATLPNFTISTWFNKNNNGILIGNHFHNSTWESVWFSTELFIVNGANNNTTNRQSLSFTAPSNSVWNNLVAVNSSSLGFMKVYLNGSEIATRAATVVPWNSSILPTIGTQRNVNTTLVAPINGQIPIVNVYNRALSAAEVQQNFNALRGRFGI